MLLDLAARTISLLRRRVSRKSCGSQESKQAGAIARRERERRRRRVLVEQQREQVGPLLFQKPFFRWFSVGSSGRWHVISWGFRLEKMQQLVSPMLCSPLVAKWVLTLRLWKLARIRQTIIWLPCCWPRRYLLLKEFSVALQLRCLQFP